MRSVCWEGQQESTNPRSCKKEETGIVNGNVGLANLRVLKRMDHSVIGGSVRPTTQRVQKWRKTTCVGSAHHEG